MSHDANMQSCISSAPSFIKCKCHSAYPTLSTAARGQEGKGGSGRPASFSNARNEKAPVRERNNQTGRKRERARIEKRRGDRARRKK